MVIKGSKTTKAEAIKFSGYVHFGLKGGLWPLKIDFKHKMAHIEFFSIKIEGNKKYNKSKYGKNDPVFEKILNF